MKKLLAPILGVVAFALVFACSAAQKQAEGDLAQKATQCGISCGVKKAIMNVPASDAVTQCAAECGIDLTTNPDAWKDLSRIIAGAQAGVAAARDAGTDAQ